MDRGELVAVLSELANDYGKWIEEQTSRIGADVVGHDAEAVAALDRCKEIQHRLEEGIAVLADTGNDKALAAFGFANRAMARQRVHSLFALSQRRGENKTLADFEQRTESIVAAVPARLHPALDSISGRPDAQRPHQAD